MKYKMTFKNFFKVVDVAKDNGYREVYIKKCNVTLMQRKNIFFNMSGIYSYKDGRFFPVCDFKKEKLTKDKILEKLCIEKNDRKKR